MQDSQQKVLLFYAFCPLYTCLKHSKFQNIARLFVEDEVAGLNWHLQFVFPDFLFQFRLDRLYIKIQTIEHVDNSPILHPQQTQQQMFGPYRPAG